MNIANVIIEFHGDRPYDAFMQALDAIKANLQFMQLYGEMMLESGTDQIEIPLHRNYSIDEPKPEPFGHMLVELAPAPQDWWQEIQQNQ